MTIRLFALLLLILIIGCKSQHLDSLPENVVGIKDPNTNTKIYKDSLHVITPAIEVYKRVDNRSFADYSTAAEVRNFVIETLGSSLNKKDYYEIPKFTSKFSRYYIEGILGNAEAHSNWIIKVPEEIIVKEVKYTVLTYIVSGYGDKENGVILMATINNEKGIIENIKRRQINKSAMNPAVLKLNIDALLSELTVTL